MEMSESKAKYKMMAFTFEQAVTLCKWLLEHFKPDHERVKVFVGFEVEPAVYSECNHCETPEEALRTALREDELERGSESGEK